MKTGSPQLGHLLQQVIDATVQLGKLRRITGRDSPAARAGTFIVVLSGHGS